MSEMPTINCVICGTNKHPNLMASSDICQDCGDKNRHCEGCGANRLAKMWIEGSCPECSVVSKPSAFVKPSQPSATSVALDSKPDSKKVVVTDIQMPFESMVIFMIKWAFASIPAAIILGVVWMLLIALAS